MKNEMADRLSKMSGQELFRYASQFDNAEFELTAAEVLSLLAALCELGKKQLIAGSSLQLGSVGVSRNRIDSSVVVRLNRRKLEHSTEPVVMPSDGKLLVLTFAERDAIHPSMTNPFVYDQPTR